jgi:hypothetical protein
MTMSGFEKSRRRASGKFRLSLTALCREHSRFGCQGKRSTDPSVALPQRPILTPAAVASGKIIGAVEAMSQIPVALEHLAVAGVQATADALEQLAEMARDRSSKAAYRSAARALFQQDGGRPSIDDHPLLLQVNRLIAEGAKSENAALIQVAATVAHDLRSLQTIAERLRKKRRKTPTK